MSAPFTRSDRSIMRGTPTLAPVLALTMLAAGCHLVRRAPAPAAPAAQAAPPAPQPLPASALVYYDNGGGIQDSLRLVIRDEGSLRSLWSRATSTQPSPPPLPAVDFTREMLLVAAGGRMSPADQIRLDSVAVREEGAAAGARQRVLEAVVHTVRGCQRFSSDAYPVAIVRVPRVDGPVRFTERRERAEGCP